MRTTVKDREISHEDVSFHGIIMCKTLSMPRHLNISFQIINQLNRTNFIIDSVFVSKFVVH